MWRSRQKSPRSSLKSFCFIKFKFFKPVPNYSSIRSFYYYEKSMQNNGLYIFNIRFYEFITLSSHNTVCNPEVAGQQSHVHLNFASTPEKKRIRK